MRATKPRKGPGLPICTNHDKYLRIPGFILRGQILSITLATVLISFILLREWITQHNWAEHAPRLTEREADVIPDEWTVRKGIAYRNEDIQEDAGVLMPASQRYMAAKNAQDTTRNGRMEESSIHLITAEKNGSASSRSVSGTGDIAIQTEAPLEPSTESMESQRRIQVQSKMSLWQPIFDMNTTLTASTIPVGDTETAVTLAQIPNNPPERGDGTDVVYETSAGPSRLALDLSASQLTSFATPAVAISDVRSDGISESSRGSALTSPGGGSPRPAAPLKPAAGVAYTAPELLNVKGKGKARAIEANQENETSGPDPFGMEDANSNLGISAVHDSFEARSPLASYKPSDATDRIPESQIDNLVVEIDPQDAGASERRFGVFDPYDGLPEAEASSPRECPEAPNDQPADIAYRDAGFSSGQQSPSTISERTVAASEDDSVIPSPLTAPLVLDVEDAPGDRLPVVAAAPLLNPQHLPVNGGDVDAQVLEEDEDEDVHWEREDWNGVLEGTARLLARQDLLVADRNCSYWPDRSASGNVAECKWAVSRALLCLGDIGHVRDHHYGCRTDGPCGNTHHPRQDLLGP